uniref:WS_DGAT_C domain-containing protein n=1 Tax=Ascaris lumbricoides TaxID=6252 RepID=A0A0M3IUG1_ASCLU
MGGGEDYMLRPKLVQHFWLGVTLKKTFWQVLSQKMKPWQIIMGPKARGGLGYGSVHKPSFSCNVYLTSSDYRLFGSVTGGHSEKEFVRMLAESVKELVRSWLMISQKTLFL